MMMLALVMAPANARVPARHRAGHKTGGWAWRQARSVIR